MTRPLQAFLLSLSYSQVSSLALPSRSSSFSFFFLLCSSQYISRTPHIKILTMLFAFSPQTHPFFALRSISSPKRKSRCHFEIPSQTYPAAPPPLTPQTARPSWRCTGPMAFMPLYTLFLDRALNLQIFTECHILREAFSTLPKNIQFLLSAPKALGIYQ